MGPYGHEGLSRNDPGTPASGNGVGAFQVHQDVLTRLPLPPSQRNDGFLAIGAGPSTWGP